MAYVVIIQIEGVLTDPADTDRIPVSNPSLAGLRFVGMLAEQWPVVYVTEAREDQAKAWLADVGAPSGTWIISTPSELRATAIMGLLARRTDRAQLYLTSSHVGVSELLDALIPVMVYYPARHALGDWRRPSSWPVDPAPSKETP